MQIFKHFKYDAEAFKSVMEKQSGERPKLPPIVATHPFYNKDSWKNQLSESEENSNGNGW